MLFHPAGDLLIIMAQVIVSVQMVLEEKFVYKHDVHPLRAVGTEGKLLFTTGETDKTEGNLFAGIGDKLLSHIPQLLRTSLIVRNVKAKQVLFFYSTCKFEKCDCDVRF